MTRIGLFLLGIILAASVSGAPAGELRGRIVDSGSGEGVAGAVVQGLAGGKAVCFASADGTGAFVLKVRAQVDTISVRAMGYEKLLVAADADLSAVCLRPEATVLREVVVQSPDIYSRGDTLVFNVSQFAKAEDNAIIDVIKRLPGVKVKDDGTITYQGKPINKFYIDGSDFIGGQYGLATENISHKDVASVEVLENHQPVKALEGIDFPEEAGINLKLKEDARSRWVGVAQGGAGATPMLYDASLYAMRIAPRLQTVLTAAADNTGRDPSSLLADHDFDDMFDSEYMRSQWPEYISADIVKAPLAENRTRDNRSWLASGINAWRRGDVSMRAQKDNAADRLDYLSSARTEYLGASIPDFVQNSDLRTQEHALSALFTAEVNRRGYFLKDKFDVRGEWNRGHSAVTGTSDRIQRTRRRSISANNDLKIVKRSDRRIFTLNSRNTFAYNPADLAIGDTVQCVDATDFRSTTSIQHGRFFGWWKVFAEGGADLAWHGMRPSLSGLPTYDNRETIDVFTASLYVRPRLDYDRGLWRVSLTLPLRWVYYGTDGHHNFVSASPRIYAHRQVGAKSDVSGSVSASFGPVAPYMFVTVPVLADFRNLFIAVPSSGYSRSVTFSGSYRYRNPLRALFANVTASYTRSHSPLTACQLFEGDIIISTFHAAGTGSDSWNVGGAFSKGMGHGKMLAGVEVSFGGVSGESMRQGAKVGFSQLSMDLRPYFKGNPARWLSASYEARLAITSLRTDGSARSGFGSLRQKLSVTVFPHDLWQLTAGVEHYLTRFADGSTARLPLLDASAVWRPSERVRLSLTARNLFDRRYYRYTAYGTLSRSEYAYAIRPCNVLASVQVRF